MQSSIQFNQFWITVLGSAIGAIFSIFGSLIIMRIKEKRQQQLEVDRLEPRVVVGHSDIISVCDDFDVAEPRIEVPLINGGASSIYTIEIEVGFSSKFLDILDVSNPNGELIKLNAFRGDSWVRKSISLESIPSLSSGESTMMSIPSVFVKTLVRKIAKEKNIDYLNEWIEQDRLSLDVGVTLRDSLMVQRRYSSELRIQLMMIQPQANSCRIDCNLVSDSLLFS